MNKKTKMLLIIVVLSILMFYAVPQLSNLMPEGSAGAFRQLMLFAFAAFCGLCAFFYGKEFGFKWYVCVLPGIIFVPSINMFYDSTVADFATTYLLIGLAGGFVGYMIYTKKQY